MQVLNSATLLSLAAHALKILVILGLGYTLVRILKSAVARLEERLLEKPGREADDRVQRARTIARLLQNVGQFTIGIVVLTMVLGELNVNIGPVLAGLGIVGLALGFGTQTLVRDAVSGLFVLIEDQFGVGDVIKAGGVTGRVEKVTLRTTHLRDEEGALHVIPNGSLGVVTNYTREWSRAAVEVTLPEGTPTDTVLEALKIASDRLLTTAASEDILAGPDLVAVLRRGQKAPVLRLSFRTRPARQWSVATRLHRATVASLSESGLSAPVSVVSPSFSLDEAARIESA